MKIGWNIEYQRDEGWPCNFTVGAFNSEVCKPWLMCVQCGTSSQYYCGRKFDVEVAITESRKLTYFRSRISLFGGRSTDYCRPWSDTHVALTFCYLSCVEKCPLKGVKYSSKSFHDFYRITVSWIWSAAPSPFGCGRASLPGGWNIVQL